MKTLKIVLALFVMGSSLLANAQKSNIDSESSVVKWVGKKIGGSHNGEIKVKKGYLVIEKDRIVEGEIVMDMNSITNSDLEDAGYNQKLVGHLKSDDFFGVEQYPTSSFKLTKASPFINGKSNVEGLLTIKNKTEKIAFNVVRSNNLFQVNLEVDRSKFDVRYGSNSFFGNLGDKAINDIFTLEIQLKI